MASDGPIVFFDLEATGLRLHKDEIVQIGARCGKKTFMRYILPSEGVKFTHEASQVTGLTVRNGRLCKDGEPVDTTPRKQVWQEFVDFLDKRGGANKVVLAAHNGIRFDFPVLLREFKKLGLLSELYSVASHACDTKRVFPNCQRIRLAAYARVCGVSADNAHDAMGDVNMMIGLCEKLNKSDSALRKVAMRLELFNP